MQKFKYLVYSCFTAGLRFAESAYNRGNDVKIISHRTNSFNPLYELTLPSKMVYFDKITDSSLRSEIEQFSPDFIVSLVFNKKIPSNHFPLAKRMAVNIHPSRLPDIRTGDSILWNILLEDSTFGVTMHKLTDQWDQGDILMAKQLELDPYETRDSMILKVEKYMANSSSEFQLALENNTYKLLPQVNGTYYPKFKPKFFYLSLNEEPEFIEKLVRASGNEFSVVLSYKGNNISLLSVYLTDRKSSSAPGTIVIDGDNVYLNTKKTQLKISSLFLTEHGVLDSKKFIEIFSPKSTDRFEPKHDDSSKQVYAAWAKCRLS